jgi:hypothetical protein
MDKLASFPVKNTARQIIIIGITETLQFIKSLVTAPAIIMAFVWLIMLYILVQNSVIGGTFAHMVSSLPFIHLSGLNGSYHFNGNDILNIFGYATLVVSIILSIIRYVFKIKLKVSFKKKLLAGISLPILLFLVTSTLFLTSHQLKNGMDVFLVLFVIASVMANFVAITVSFVINFVISQILTANLESTV